MKRIMFPAIVVLIFTVLVSSCTSAPGDQAGTAVEESSLATKPAGPTATPVPPSSTPIPTETSVPTETPIPTDTPTSAPTETPTITPTFSPDTLTFTAGEPLKIGYLLWESNPIGLDSKRAIELAIQGFGGELFGHPIELIGFDEECSELGGQRGAQLLGLDDSVVGIIGSSCSVAARRAAPIVSDAGRVLISPSNTSPELTDPDGRAAGYFRTVPNDTFQANAVAQYAYDQLAVRKMATIYTQNQKYQKTLAQHVCQSFTSLGGECVLEKAIASNATYMVPIINNILDAKADAIHLSHFSPQVAAEFIAEVRKTKGLENVPIFVFEGLNTPDFLQKVGENAVGIFVSTTAMDFDLSTDSYQGFLSAYREKYGEDPISQFHGFAYDAAMILLDAMYKVAVQSGDGSLLIDPLAVRQAISTLVDFPGLTGSLTCSPQGDCSPLVDGRVYRFEDADPNTFRPGPPESLSSNPVQVWP